MKTTIIIPDDELPLWMRMARRSIDYGFLLVIGFCLIVSWHFIFNNELPHTNAAEHFVFRGEETFKALNEGRVYPRWSANVLQGLGAPISHFYPPAASYGAGLLAFMFTADAEVAVRMLFVLCFIIAGTMTYTLVMQHANATAGVIAALLYVLSPHIGQTVPHILGDLAQLMALALLPTLLWSVQRLLARNLASDMLIVSIVGAVLLLAMPQMMAVGLLLASLLCIIHFRRRLQLSPLLMVAVALIASFGLSAFYWLPALLEANTVTWIKNIVPQQVPSITLLELLQPLRPYDPAAMIQRPQWTLGWPIVMCSVASLLIAIPRLRFFNIHAAMFFAGCVLGSYLVFVDATQSWLVGSITLCFSIGASGFLHPALNYTVITHRLMLISSISIILGLSSPVWFATYPTLPQPDITARAYEDNGWGVPGLPVGSPLPTTLNTPYTTSRIYGIMPDDDSLIQPLTGSTLNPAVNLRARTSHRYSFDVQVNNASSLQFAQSYFNGWQATLNGSPIVTTRADESGLINLSLPDDANGILEIQLGTTPPRQAGWILSGASILLLIIISIWRWRSQIINYDESLLLYHWDARYILLVLFIITLILLLNATTPILHGYRTASGANLNQLMQQNIKISSIGIRNDDLVLEEQLTLFGYHISHAELARSGQIDVTVYLQADVTLIEDYQTRLQLLDVNTDQVYPLADLRPPGFYPTSRWTPGYYVEDQHLVTIPASIPDGTYHLQVIIVPCEATCETNGPALLFNLDDDTLQPYLNIIEDVMIR